MQTGKSVFLVLVFFLLARVSFAQTPDALSLPSPDQWNYITASQELTTSQCIGVPKSPLCAMETLLACFQRDEFQLCRMVDDKADEYAQVFASPSPRERYLAYRLVQGVTFKGPAPEEDPVIQAGDVMLVVDQRDGALGVSAPPTNAPDQRFILRQQADKRWKIINWGGPDD